MEEQIAIDHIIISALYSLLPVLVHSNGIEHVRPTVAQRVGFGRHQPTSREERCAGRAGIPAHGARFPNPRGQEEAEGGRGGAQASKIGRGLQLAREPASEGVRNAAVGETRTGGGLCQGEAERERAGDNDVPRLALTGTPAARNPQNFTCDHYSDPRGSAQGGDDDRVGR